MSEINKFLREKRKEEEKKQKNIIYDKLIDNFLPYQSLKKEQFTQWFEGYLKNYIHKNNIDLDNDYDFRNQLLHTIDYLNSPYSKKRFDRMTWEISQKQVLEWDSALQKRKEKGDDPEGINLFCELKDDWCAVEIISKKALSYEGGTMGHCVGTYHNKVENGTVRIFSIRDKNNDSHITIEYSNISNKIVQIQGKQNKFPIEKHRKYLAEFLSDSKFIVEPKVIQPLNITQIGWNFYSFNNLEEKNNFIKKTIEKGHYSGGVLDCEHISLDEIKGKWDYISIKNSNIEKFSKDTELKSLYIFKSDIKNFEEGIEAQSVVIKNSKGDIPSYIESNNIELNNLNWEKTPLIKCNNVNFKSLNLKEMNPIIAKEHASFYNIEFIEELPQGYYNHADINYCSFNKISEEAIVKSLEINYTPIQKVDLSKIESIVADSIDVSFLSGYKNEEPCKIMLSNCSGIKDVSDINAPHLILKLQNCNELVSLSNVKASTISLRGCANLEKLNRNSCNTLDIFGVSQNLEMNRNRFKKIITSKNNSIRKNNNTEPEKNIRKRMKNN